MKHAGNAPLLIACNKSELSDSISDEAIDMADQNGYQVDVILDRNFYYLSPSTMSHCALVNLIKKFKFLFKAF